MFVLVSCLWNLKFHRNFAIYSSPKIIVTDLEDKCHTVHILV